MIRPPPRSPLFPYPTLFRSLDDLVDAGATFDPAPVYERLVKEAAARVRGFTVYARYALGTFSYAKLPMVTDLLTAERSEEHTSELQSRSDLVCRLLLEKKKK